MCKGKIQRRWHNWRWWLGLALLVVGISMGGSALNSQADDTLPFPDSSVGSYIFGVGSYYNAFAAGKLTIAGNAVTTLEGRYAGNQIVQKTDTSTWDTIRWNELTDLSPVYVANTVPIDSSDTDLKTQAENMQYFLNAKPERFPTANKVVINNLRDLAQNHWGTADKEKNQVLINHLENANVGDVNYFRDNRPFMEKAYQVQTGKRLTLDPQKVDASDYFSAAAAQIKQISNYYAAFNNKAAIVANDQVASTSGEETLAGENPELTIKLAKDYQKSFSDEPPIIFVNLSGKPAANWSGMNVTINIENMDTTTSQSGDSGGPSYATYQYAPYIFVNWTGIKDNSPFTWGSAYKFTVTDQKGTKITNDQNNNVTNSDNSKATVNQLLSSHILNNFPNAVTTGNDYLTVDNSDGSNYFTGSVMLPDASLRLTNQGSGFFYGNAISGKNVEIANNMLPARVMASSFDVQHISSDNVTQLDPNRQPEVAQPKLQSLTLSSKKVGEDSKVVLGGATGAYTVPQAEGPVALSAKVTTQKTDYHLFYQLNGQAWHTIDKPTGQDTTNATNELTLGNLLNLTDANQDGLTAGDSQSQTATFDPSTSAKPTQDLKTTLERVNKLKAVVTPATDKDGKEITTTNLAEQLESYPTTTVTVTETGALTATLPTTFALKRVGSDYTASPHVQVTNDWQVPVSLTLGSAPQLTGVLHDGALPIQLTRPLSYQATLDGVTTQHTLGDPATTLLGQTSPATTAKDIAFNLTLATNATSATQPGKTYYVPLNWHLNYGSKNNLN